MEDVIEIVCDERVGGATILNTRGSSLKHELLMDTPIYSPFSI